MHFEILVEDQSGKKALDILVPKIIGARHTCKVIAYKGVGRIPKNMNTAVDAGKRMLLDNLPRLLKGYGRSWTNYPAAVFVVCDLDDKCLKKFRQELYAVLGACNPARERLRRRRLRWPTRSEPHPTDVRCTSSRPLPINVIPTSMPPVTISPSHSAPVSVATIGTIHVLSKNMVTPKVRCT